MAMLKTAAKMFGAILLLSPLPGAFAQGGLGGSGMAGAESVGSTTSVYIVQHQDGSSESGSFVKLLRYYLAPGWAKPRRVVTTIGPGGDFYGSFASRSGQARYETATGNRRDWPVSMNTTLPIAGGINIDVLIAAKAEGERHSQVFVGRIGTNGVLNPEPQMSGAMGGMGGMGGMPGGMGTGSGMPGQSMGMGGSTMGGGMMMGAEGGMGGMAEDPSEIRIVPLDETRYLPTNDRSTQLSVSQLKTVMELVRVDCAIEEELDNLRTSRRDADEFKKAEGSLKELLGKEYELQLSKQREDIDRLAEKLKVLQEELSRRASAQGRVVDVQLGQLVLEAQGLIGERP